MSSDSSPPVRVRFAPSPTGLLHIGGLRTALYNYLFARQHGGTMVLRIEDTDQKRFVAEAESDILTSLAWSGLTYDEGPDVGGPYASYYQSRRTGLYQLAAERLLADGNAYYAFDTEDELAALRAQPNSAYNARTRGRMTNAFTLRAREVKRRIEAGEPHVVRLKVPVGETVHFTDIIRGEIAIGTDEVDDQVLIKSDGLPTYHLANVVDDHEMAISHVIRGEEWLPSVPKHLLLYRFLGYTPPQMAHLPLILSPTGGKLSKRKADKQGIPVSVQQYRKGYTSPKAPKPGEPSKDLPPVQPDALINFLAFLGWNPGTDQELFLLDDLVEAFSLKRVGSAGVQFSVDKLKWYNAQYVRALPMAVLAAQARPALEAAGLTAEDAYLEAVVALVQERLTFVSEVATGYRFLFEDPTAYDEKVIRKQWKAGTAALLDAAAEALETVVPFDAPTAKAALKGVVEAEGVKLGQLFAPARLALVGAASGPDLFDMMALLGRDTSIRRFRAAAEQLG